MAIGQRASEGEAEITDDRLFISVCSRRLLCSRTSPWTLLLFPRLFPLANFTRNVRPLRTRNSRDPAIFPRHETIVLERLTRFRNWTAVVFSRTPLDRNDALGNIRRANRRPSTQFSNAGRSAGHERHRSPLYGLINAHRRLFVIRSNTPRHFRAGSAAKRGKNAGKTRTCATSRRREAQWSARRVGYAN